jgi:hypothetical protein
VCQQCLWCRCPYIGVTIYNNEKTGPILFLKLVYLKTSCAKYVICAHKIFTEILNHSCIFSSLYVAYEYMIPLPYALTLKSHVNVCVFSVVKFVKNKVRSSLGQNDFNALMLMFLERESTFNLAKLLLMRLQIIVLNWKICSYKHTVCKVRNLQLHFN